MLRHLSEDREDINMMECIKVCRILSYCRASLDNYARMKDLPHSAVRVDEDFHYMRESVVQMITLNIPIQ